MEKGWRAGGRGLKGYCRNAVRALPDIVTIAGFRKNVEFDAQMIRV
jgi:hypothetical protein